MVRKTYKYQHTKEKSSCKCFRKKTSTNYSLLHSKEKTMETFVIELKQSLLKKMRMKELLNTNQT